jgi:dihydroorotase
MANTDPPIDNALILTRVNQLIAERACIEVIPVACVTKNMAGLELTNMVELAALGAGAFSDNGMPIMNLAVLRRALEYAQLADRMIISHAEDKDLAAGGSVNESPTSTRLGMRPIPAAAETAAVAREIEIVRQTGWRLHFAHISTAASVELIANAKKSGLQVTADVTPHHITLTDEDITDFDTAYKMNPPLRSQADRKALIEGLKNGTIDAIASDHAPHSRSDKAKTFDQAPFGVISLETAFPLAYEQLVLEKHLTIEKLFKLFATNPAAILKRELVLSKGAAANLAIIDLNQQWVYDAEKGHSKSNNSPFNGRKLTGKNLATIYNGTLVYKDEHYMHARISSADAVKQR